MLVLGGHSTHYQPELVMLTLIAMSAVCVVVLMKKIKRKRLDFHGLNACVNDGFMKTVTVKW